MTTTHPHRRSFLSITFASLALSAIGCSGSDAAPAADMGPTVTALTQGANYNTPLDAAPTPDGVTVYFTARGAGGQGVFRVAAAGGAVTEVRTGAPFASPTGISLGTDGQRVYVADGQAGTGGAILVMPVAGGAPEVLMGTAGTNPRGLDIVRRDGVDQIYFTGTTTDTRRPALFRVPAAGGALVTVASGAPFTDPSGVAVTREGVGYVSDRGNGMLGSIVRVDTMGMATTVLNNERLGNPAGVALTPDERTLLISAIDPMRGTSRVTLLDLMTLQTSTFDRVIGGNRASGGLHRAFSALRVLAWCGVTAGTGGQGVVYRVNF